MPALLGCLFISSYESKHSLKGEKNIMEKEQIIICEKAIEHFGVDPQVEKAKEELAELIVELSRAATGRMQLERIREELADAIIMCQQLRLIMGAEETDLWIQAKLERLTVRMADEEGEQDG